MATGQGLTQRPDFLAAGSLEAHALAVPRHRQPDNPPNAAAAAALSTAVAGWIPACRQTRAREGLPQWRGVGMHKGADIM